MVRKKFRISLNWKLIVYNSTLNSSYLIGSVSKNASKFLLDQVKLFICPIARTKIRIWWNASRAIVHLSRLTHDVSVQLITRVGLSGDFSVKILVSTGNQTCKLLGQVQT